MGGNATGSGDWNKKCTLVHNTISRQVCGPGNAYRAIPRAGFGRGTNATSFKSTLSGPLDPSLNGTLIECIGTANTVDPGNLVGKGVLKLKGQCVFTYLELSFVRVLYV